VSYIYIERERELAWKWNWKSLLGERGKDEGMDEKKCDGTKTIFSFMCILVVEKSYECAERIRVHERAVELEPERREC
jgi:hypothetical protein